MSWRYRLKQTFLSLCTGLGLLVWAAAGQAEDRAMVEHVARGTFEVVMQPIGGTEGAMTCMSMQKTFSGDMVGTGAGNFLAIRSVKEGSAGYVAMERITATLDGRHGSFALQHSGVMQGGTQSAIIKVVPDTGADGLTGLTGDMQISIPAGQHHYVFSYSLPAS